MLRIKVDVLQFRLYKNSLKNPTYEVAENKHNHIFPSTQRMREK